MEEEETARECLEDADWDVQVAVERFLSNPPPQARAQVAEAGYYSLEENPLEETLDKPEPMPDSRCADAKAAASIVQRGGWIIDDAPRRQLGLDTGVAGAEAHIRLTTPARTFGARQPRDQTWCTDSSPKLSRNMNRMVRKVGCSPKVCHLPRCAR